MKRRIFFWSVFFTVFLDCRSTNLLRLFSGNLPAMFLRSVHIFSQFFTPPPPPPTQLTPTYPYPPNYPLPSPNYPPPPQLPQNNPPPQPIYPPTPPSDLSRFRYSTGYVFSSSSDALFRFTFVHTAKLKKSNFLNVFFLSLTAFVCARDVISHSLLAKVFCVVRFWSQVAYLTQ